MGENWQYGMKVEFQVTKVLADEQMSKCRMKYVETPCHGKVLFMDGEVQFSTADEARYGEMMLRDIPELPHVSNQPIEQAWHSVVDILILGGGDGLLARDILKQCPNPSVTIVDWDAKFVEWASKNIPENKGSLKDPRVRVLDMDVRDPYVVTEGKLYDMIILDLPDPDSPEMQDLYIHAARKMLPVLMKNHCVVKAHVGPAMSNNENHSNWAFIDQFSSELKTMIYMTRNRGANYRLDTKFIPSYMHEWGFVTFTTFKRGGACCGGGACSGDDDHRSS